MHAAKQTQADKRTGRQTQKNTIRQTVIEAENRKQTANKVDKKQGVS